MLCRDMTTPAEFEGLVQRNLAASCSFSFLDFVSLLHLAVSKNLRAAEDALQCILCDGDHAVSLSSSCLHAEQIREAAVLGRQTCSCVLLYLQALLELKRAGSVLEVLGHDMAAWAALNDEDHVSDGDSVCDEGPAAFRTFAEGVWVCRHDCAAIKGLLLSVGETL